ncbi:hypothetical protein CAPTEDRAFT_214008 [Capitella teleta]|uniref:SET domain-containing protein n=1 Tax=Capitella teleta TaxID=283909 RepID=R7TL93_CAPTE|nr:hypothetical protein CAPTEDRAFT_214008 [Capitella teleta]|eukprot:ELT94282.1 hypothetical protein CAPTEDRAFT_214008 [Capitella teleta]
MWKQSGPSRPVVETWKSLIKTDGKGWEELAIMNKTSKGRGLITTKKFKKEDDYSYGRLINHSLTPNLKPVKVHLEAWLVFKANRDINVGEELGFNYADMDDFCTMEPKAAFLEMLRWLVFWLPSVTAKCDYAGVHCKAGTTLLGSLKSIVIQWGSDDFPTKAMFQVVAGDMVECLIHCARVSGLLRQCFDAHKDMEGSVFIHAENILLHSDVALERLRDSVLKALEDLDEVEAIIPTGAVSHTTYCDFLLWSPERIVVQRLSVDSNWQAATLHKLHAFWSQHILPRLVSPDAPDAAAPNDSSQENTHCSSGHPDGEDMIGCNYDGCPNKWYHGLVWASRKHRPRGKPGTARHAGHAPPPAKRRKQKKSYT